MSKLDSYISKLLSDDDALKDFLVDPIKAAEDDHGLTKGQRSVLRRVVANLSNNATNGYSIIRHLDSYRRSIRLLQNVLHLEKASAIDSHPANAAEAVGKGGNKLTPLYTYRVIVYYNGDPAHPRGSVTNPAAQYSQHAIYYSTAPFGSTLKTIMDQSFGLVYGKQTFNPGTGDELAVTSFTIGGDTYAAAPQDPRTSTDAFWYFSVGGRAITDVGYGTTGYEKNPLSYQGYAGGGTFETFVPPSGQNTIYWQCIAPDKTYGFASCKPATADSVFK